MRLHPVVQAVQQQIGEERNGGGQRQQRDRFARLPRPHGRPAKIIGKTQEIRDLARKGLSKSAIAKQLNIGRTSVRRLLADA